MIIPDEQIKAVVFPESAFEKARLHYAAFRRISFEDDLVDYLHTGFVVSRPDLFALAKVIVHPRDDKKPAWFIRYANGALSQIARVLPFYLDTLVFCRNDNGQLRVYSTDRLLELGKKKPVHTRKLEVMEAI